MTLDPPDTLAADSREPFTLSPEQQHIVGLLERLLGSPFANRYKDFCRLVSGSTGLRASKPMAAHALRELESMMRSALVVPMEAKAIENKQDLARAKSALKMLKREGYGVEALQRAARALKPQYNHAAEIKLIGARLGLSEASEAVQAWISLTRMMGRAHERHFHRSMSVDDAFRKDFQRPLDLILAGVLAALQKRYAAFMKRVESIVAMSDRAEAIHLFETEVPSALPLQWHFYQRIDSSDWLPHLLEHQLVREPPLDADDTEVTEYGPWPIGHYLLNVAKSGEASAIPYLVDALRGVQASQHPAVKRFGLDAIAALPPAAANELLNVVIEWLDPETPNFYYTAPEAILKHLAESGYIENSLKVAATLFRVFERSGEIASIHPQHMYEHHLPGAINVLASRDGLATVRLFSGILLEAASISNKASGEDYSYMTSDPLSNDRMAGYGIREALIVAVRNAALLGCQARPEVTPDIVRYLLDQPLKIFTRIALHVLSKGAAAASEEAASLLTNTDLIAEHWCEDEYAELALAYFPQLSANQQAGIFSHIDSLADLGRAAWRESFFARHNKQPSVEDEQRYDSAILQEAMWKWRAVLPHDRQQQLEDSVKLLGDPEDWLHRLFPPEVSPVTLSDLAAKPIPELLALLGRFVPSEEPVRQTINALGQQLREAVEQEPERFAAAAAEFADVRPFYVRRLLEAFETIASKKEKSLDWGPILSLLQSVAERLGDPRNSFPQAEGDDDNWFRCCSTASHLLRTALAHSHTNISLERAKEIEKFIATLIESAPHQPTSQDFESQFERHPAFTAAQSLWGSAVELCAIFVWWHSRQKDSPVHKEPRSAFQLLPSIPTLLERSLDDRSTWGRIPRAVLGQRLKWLMHFGEEWLMRQLPALLPDDEPLRRATWLGHLTNDTGPVLNRTVTQHLLPSYVGEIERLGAGQDSDNAENRAKRLGDYLLLLWIADIMPDDLLRDFFARASGYVRRHTIGYLGQTLQLPSEQLPDENRVRVRRFWETRLAVACAAPNKDDFREELAGIGQWFIHDAANIDPDWLIEQLLTLFRAGLAPNNGYSLVDWLGQVASSHAAQAVRVLAAMLDNQQLNHWSYITHTQPIRTVLQQGLLADQVTAQRARDIINVLATMAQPEYLALLEADTEVGDISESTP